MMDRASQHAEFSTTAFAPASVGNLTAGYDLLGMCLQAPGDLVSARFNTSGKLQLTGIVGDGGRLPVSVTENTGTVAAQALLSYVGEARGVDLFIEKQMPLGSGMGSSAASAVAAVVAVNALLGSPLSKPDLIPFALAGEKIASGAVHGDNVVPSLLGGVVLTLNCDPVDVIELPVPEGLCYALVHPDLQILTKEARLAVPASFTTSVVTQQMGYLSGLVSGFYERNVERIAKNLVDQLAEPYRQPLIAGFDSVREAALGVGALNCGISGSGPSVYALVRDRQTAQAVATAMKDAFSVLQIGARSYWGEIDHRGAHVIARSEKN